MIKKILFSPSKLALTFLVLALAVLVPILAACGSNNKSTTTSTATPILTATSTEAPTIIPTISAAKSLTGAGATFPAPLYSKWFDEYNKLTGVAINYQAIGSGGGIKAITDGTADFGASDGIMSDAEQAAAEAKGGPIMHIPMVSGSVAVVYNISGIKSGELKLTPDVLADIYLGKLTKWNDSRITAINPGLTLPNADIAVVHRSDGSGTTYIFTNYLSKVSTDWNSKVGNAKSVQWPVGIGGSGNAGVAGQVQQLSNSIGYIELAYAIQNNIPWAKLQNKAGNYIEPSLAATTAAAVGVTLPDDMKVMITDSANPDAYPIAGFTWILAYKNQQDQAKGLALARMLWWAIHDGQKYSEQLQYGPLPSDAVVKAENLILSMNYNGQPLITR
jgi:phosphate transport system substrate-binding protein